MRYQGATWRPVVNHSGAMAHQLGLVLHVQQGTGSLAGYFDNPNAMASSHFWIGKDGRVEQYVDTDVRAWAQAQGNTDYLSVETEGRAAEPLTDAQVASLAALYAWGMDHYAWPLRLAERPRQMGLGWHGMGGTAWGNHPGCPGDLRKTQRADVLGLIIDGRDWLTMASKQDVKDAVREVLAEQLIQDDDAGPGARVSVLTALYRAYSNSRRIRIHLGA